MRLPAAREGEDVVVRHKRTPFSFWPTYHGTRREGLQWTLFASDPWFLIESYLSNLEDEEVYNEAYAFLAQARDFYRAATDSDISAAKPLLLYYAFLNLGKCLATYRGAASLGSNVKHGISEKLPTTPGAIYGDANILRNQDANSAFKKFSDALGDALPNAVAPATHVALRSQDFLAQILIGHRVWCSGEGIKERFISLQDVRYRHDPTTQEMWVRVRMYKDDLSRFSYSQTAAASALNIGGGGQFRTVICDEAGEDDRELIEFEQIATEHYPNRPSESLQQLSQKVRKSLWRSVTSYPPYRKYYIYIPTAAQTILSQLQSLYLSCYYFGSITRYKPASFATILDSDIGAFVQEFFTNQPSQILYLITSEFVEQEVTRAAIV
ncbi:MAG TPA: YaaC family protein [Allosphingosinicella sp.]|nr:YaaC family protein [Allosphingosinicella sp.]